MTQENPLQQNSVPEEHTALKELYAYLFKLTEDAQLEKGYKEHMRQELYVRLNIIAGKLECPWPSRQEIADMAEEIKFQEKPYWKPAPAPKDTQVDPKAVDTAQLQLLTAMVDSGEYDWASMLPDLLVSITKRGKLTENQLRAVKNIARKNLDFCDRVIQECPEVEQYLY